MQTKKATRAYKVGHTDGRNGEFNDPYAEGSTRSADYQLGYAAGAKS